MEAAVGEAHRRAAIPSLREWLATMMPSRDAAARDEFADFADWVVRMLAHEMPDQAREAMILRMVQATSLAIVETCNHECSLGASVADISADMCRSLGVSFGYALMSLDWQEDAPLRQLARLMSEEFMAGIKFAIDECHARAAADIPAPHDGSAT